MKILLRAQGRLKDNDTGKRANMFEDMMPDIKNVQGRLNPKDITGLSPLVLAFIGDAVYEVFIRTEMLARAPYKSVHNLHVMSTSYVKAHAQSETVRKMLPIFTDEELSILKRGRNSKSGFVPKNADVIEYREATGFEALIGYLYLTGNKSRLTEILNLSIFSEEEK